VVFFENTEISAFANTPANDTVQIYENTVAQKYTFEKIQIVQKLEQYGINAIYTHPAQLSLQVINKYLELKSRGI
jgi:predicted Fe-Mo cluster-binding NifX family protein